MSKEKSLENKKEASTIAKKLGFLLNPYKNLLKDTDKKPEEAETQKETEIPKPEEQEVKEQSKPEPVSLDSKPRLGKVLWKKR